MVFLEPQCSLLHMTMAQRQTGNRQRKGRKITTVVNRKQPEYQLLRYFHRGKKSKGKYAKEIPEPRRNSNIILSNNQLLDETLIEEKKNTSFFFFIQKKNDKTTNWSHGGKKHKIENILLSLTAPFKCHLTMQLILQGKKKIKYCMSNSNQFDVPYYFC